MLPIPREESTLRVAALLFPQTEMLDITGPIDVFTCANRLFPDGPIHYAFDLLGRKPGAVPLSGGLELVAHRAFGEAEFPIDTLLVPGNLRLAEQLDPQLLDWLRLASKKVRRLVSICTGAFYLAEAGLLDGRRATTHWESCSRLASRYPRVRVETDSLFVRDGSVYTSAGISAGIDLALELVEEDLGRDRALAVAREMVLFLKRPGGQSQFSVSLLAQEAESDRMRRLTSWILENLDRDLSLPVLANRIHVSPRHLARLFRSETGLSPATYVEKARLEMARRRLSESRDSIGQIARACGFGNDERMRRAFQRHLSLSPSEYRTLHRSRPRRLDS